MKGSCDTLETLGSEGVDHWHMRFRNIVPYQNKYNTIVRLFLIGCCRTAHCAAVKGSRDTLETLGSEGVDLWQPTAKGDYPIHEAAQAGHVGQYVCAYVRVCVCLFMCLFVCVFVCL